MGKRARARRMKEEGLHEIKNKYRVRAVTKKRKGLVFTAKKKRRALKAVTSLSIIFVVLLGVFAVGNSFFKETVFNVVPDDFVTVSYDVPTDGSKPDDHSALENIGYMNRRFKEQANWYAETHGTTDTAVGPQSVNTIKQYSDNVLIMVDVARSSLIKAGRQFCYVGDEVMWRNVTSDSNYKMGNYEEMLALDFKDELERHTTIEAFKKVNGLPGTEFSVYVINEETLDHADPVERVTSGEWDDKDYAYPPVYRQTYYLRPGDADNLGAAAHYANQIMFTGGLQGVSFKGQIKITYTFDSTWQVLRAEINEAYKAQMGVIKADCTSNFKTEYEYNTERTKNSAYEEFFKDLVGKGVEDSLEKPLDSLGCIMSAFLSKPETFELNLDINGKTTSGLIALDAKELGDKLDGGSVDAGTIIGGLGLKAQIGGISIYLKDSTAYLAVGDLKAKLPIDKLLTLIQGAEAEPAPQAVDEASEDESGSGEEASIFTIKDPVLSEDGKAAFVEAALDLSSMGVDLKVPLNFLFNISEEKTASLASLDASLSYEGIAAKINVKSTDQSVPDLANEDTFIDLYSYAEAVYDLIMGKKLDVHFNYENANMYLLGDIGIDFTDELLVAGDLTVEVGRVQKTVGLAVKGGVAYLNLDGIKISASLNDAIELVKGFLPQAESTSDGLDLNKILDKVLSAVFDNDLASLLTLAEKQGTLQIGLKGTELLKAFGLDFELGDVNLFINEGGVYASAYGAYVSVEALEGDVRLDTNGYVDAVYYAQAVINLLKQETLTANVSYENEIGGNELTVSGTIVLGLSPLKVSGEITVKYGSLEKKVEVVYGEDGYLYLVIDALKVKADSKDAIALISSFITTDDTSKKQEKDIYEILEKVLAIDFARLVTVFETEEGENKTLNAVIKGDELLNIFGVTGFGLDDITLSLNADGIQASMPGIGLSLTAGGSVKELTDEEKAGFIDLKPILQKIPDLVPYGEAVYELIAGKQLEIALNYANDNMRLSGTIGIDFTGDLLIAGELTLAVGKEQKTVALAVKDGVAYLNLDGIKLAVKISEAMELVKGFLPKAESGSDGLDVMGILDTVLSTVLNNDFVALFTLREEENVLTLSVKGTELLKMFGLDFELGSVTLAIEKNGTISASAYGAQISVKALENPLTVDTTGYAEVIPYVQTILDLIQSGALTANVAYSATLGGNDLTVGGTIVIGLSPLKVSGEITVKYGSLEKSVEIVYGEDGYLYLVIDALTVKADSKDAIALIASLIKTDDTSEKQEKDIYAILEKVFTIDFGKVIKIFETEEGENKTLNAVVKGSELLSLFGVEFELGDVTLSVGADGLKASALGINLSIVSGGSVKELTDAEKAEYVDLKPVLDALPELLKKKALSLSGRVVLTAGEQDILLVLNQGVLSFASGIEAYLDLSLVMTEVTLDLQLYINTEYIKIALGNLGVELAFSDFNKLGEAVVSMYEEVRKTINPISDTELLPEAKTIGELFNLLTALFTKDGAAAAALDLGDTLSQITIANSKETNGLLAVSVMGVTLDIVNLSDGFVGLMVGFENNDLKVTGAINTEVYGGKMPAMAEIGYLNEKDFEELLDYLVAAVHTLSENNINLELKGVIGSEDTQTYPTGVKYNLTGDIRLYSGENTAIHLNLDKKSLWVDTETYLYAKIALDPVLDTDKGINIELFILDCDENGKADGEILDVFVSLSLCLKSTAKNPLTLYAPANELMPVLASLVSILGVDVDIVNDYLIAPWISSLETPAQLKALGHSLLQMVAGFMGSDSVDTQESDKRAFDITSLIEAIKVGESEFELALSSEAIFGKAGEPLTVKLGKEKTENGSRLTMLSVANIQNTSIALGMNYEAKEKLKPSFKGMIPMNGVAALLQMLARSTTHRVDGEVISGEAQQHNYVLNENFYITGTISLKVLGETLKINVVAFSVTIDENGIWGVNVRFKYDHYSIIGKDLINGDTVVDLTGKDNMVYIKRVQSTDASGKTLPKDITLYRAMPLKNFGKDIIPQMGFLFNLGSTITDALNGISMGDSGEKADEDIGTTIGKYLKSIQYTRATSTTGESWTVTINGAALTKELGDIVVTFGSDTNGMLRTLTANTTLSVSILSLTANVNFTFHNPAGVMDAGVEDGSNDIAALLIDGMSYKLETVDWSNVMFIEGEYTTVDYILMGETIKSQNIVIATGTAGDKKGTVYGTLSYPDLTDYDEQGYKAVWDIVYGKDDPLPDSRQIFASYKALTFELTFDFGNGDTLKRDYLYDDDDFELPFRENERVRVAYFVDSEGNEYRTAQDLTKLWGDTLLTAVYEKIEYTVTFVIGEERREQKAYYGDAIEYPTAIEREGYDFKGWDSDAQSVTGNVTITALWQAKTYEVTFVSQYEIDGYEWTMNEDGAYTTSFTFTYDSEVSLPRGNRVMVGNHTYVLRGFCLVDGETCYFDRLPNVTANTVFYAQWQELGYDIVFHLRDGSTVTLNYHGGDVITSAELPQIEKREGYTSYWRDANGNRLTGDYTVTDEAVFTIEDVANTYNITIVSDQPYSGYASANGAYEKKITYTYDGAAVTLETLKDITDYWFMGYYTEQNGAGDEISTVSGILEDMTLYIWWKDNAVTFNICSDVEFAGSTRDTKRGGFIKTYTLRNTYDLDNSYLPKVDGYQTLALWHKTGDSYERVTNVRNLDGEDIWVLWIKNIKVNITNFTINITKVIVEYRTYTIKGFVEGGDVYGKKSIEIYNLVGEKVVTEGGYVIFNADGSKSDKLKWGDEFVIDDSGEFGAESMTSWDGQTNFVAEYGGVKVTKTFTCNGEQIVTKNAMYVSEPKYTVTYDLKNGNTVTLDKLRIGFPYSDEFDCTTYVDVLAQENGIFVPEREGYSGKWDHIAVTNSMTVEPNYTVLYYKARFESNQKIENWTEVDGKYIYECDMAYGSDVTFYFENTVLSSYKIGIADNVFTVPVLTDTQKWGAIEITPNYARFNAQRNVDMVVYNSEVSFEYDNVLYDSYTAEVTGTYTLITPTATGYTFLGWYRLVDGAWVKITVVYATAGEEKVTTPVQALWAKDLLIEFTAKNISGLTNKTHTASVNVSGGVLVGAFAKEASATIDLRYYVSDGTGYESTSNDSKPTANYTGELVTADFTYTIKSGWDRTRDYAHVVAKVTWKYAGFSFTIGEEGNGGHAYVNF